MVELTIDKKVFKMSQGSSGIVELSITDPYTNPQRQILVYLSKANAWILSNALKETANEK